MIGGYLSNLAETLIAAGRHAEARELLEQAILQQQAALKLDPENALSKEFLGIHQKILAELQTQLDACKSASEPPKEEEKPQ